MNKALLTITTTLALVFSQSLLADHNRRPGKNDGYIDYARVVHVEPIYETVRIAVPVEQCRQQQIQKPAMRRVQYASPGDVLLGGLIGGVIGHELGDGHNRGFTTAAGVIIGSTIASEANARYYHSGDYRVETRERCRTITQYRTEQQLNGYQVSYRYKGRTYTTHTQQHPGKRIAVRADVTPVRKMY